MSFDEWCLLVDAEIHKQCGLSRDDIDDWHYRSSYDDGMDAVEVAHDALENAGFSCGGLDYNSLKENNQ